MVGIHRSATWVVTGRTGSKTERKKRWAGEKWWWWIRAVGIPSQRHCWYFFTVFSLTLAQIPSLASSSLLFSTCQSEEEQQQVHMMTRRIAFALLTGIAWMGNREIANIFADRVEMRWWLREFICCNGYVHGGRQITNIKSKKGWLSFHSEERHRQRYWVVHRFAQ